jgi:YD repeat-containing protein
MPMAYNTKLGVRRLAATALVLLLAKTSEAQSESTFKAAGAQTHRDYFSELPGEHIDTLTGSLILTATDLVVPGNAGGQLRFQRTYNSKDDKWTFAIVGIPKVSESGTSPNETTIFVDDTGAAHSTVVVKKDPAGTPTERWVASAQFWKFDRQERVLYLPDGSRVYYDTSYRPIQRQDPFGNLIEIVYDGLTIRVYQQLTPKGQSGPGIDGETREVDLTYQTLGGVPTSGNPLPLQMQYQGKIWTYSNGGVVGPEGVSWGFTSDGTFLGNSGLTVTTPHGGTVRYEFETNSYVVPIGDPNEQQTVVEFSRFLKRRIVGGRDATGSDQSRTWTFTYTLDSQRLPPLSSHATIEAPSGAITAFDYNYEYDPSAFIQGAPVGPPFADSPSLPVLTERTVIDGGQTVEHESLLYTRVQIVTSDETSSVSYFSPELAQRVIERDGKSFETQYVFSATNHGDFHRPYRVIETSSDGTRTTERTFDYQFVYPFDLMGPVPVGAGSFVAPMKDETVTVNGETAERTWSYDRTTGFLASETSYGIETTYTPGILGNVATSKVGNVITEFSYDWGVVSQIKTAAHTTSRIINPDGTVASETRGTRTTQFTYDDLSRVIRSVPPAGNEVVSTYAPDGTLVAVSRGPSRTTTFLDGFGRPVQTDTQIESNKYIRNVTTFDSEGRKTFESFPFQSDGPQVGTSFTYDALNRVRTRTNTGGTSVPTDYGPGTVTVHDEEGRTTTQTWAAFGSPDGARLVALTDANQQTWNYEYNVLDKLTRVTGGGVERTWHYHPGTAQLMDETHPESGLVQYTDYDAAGNLTHKVDANHTDFSYSYDGNGRLAQIVAGGRTTIITYESNSDNRETATVDGVVSRFKYDDAGRLYARTDVVPGGGAENQVFEYDGNDNLARVTYATGRIVAYTYDVANRVIAVDDVTPDNSTTNNKHYATDVQYHPSGALVAYTTGNQVQHTFAYDPNRYWPTQIHASAGNFNVTYSDYDGVGNVRTLLGSGTGFNQTFQYDALDRLTRADGPYGSVYYAYDANGNRQAAGGTTYTYDHQRLINQAGSGFSQTFTYDDNGNLKTGPYQGDRYDYTPDNQLSSSTVNGVDATYQYDADGWRISKTSQGYTYVYTRGANGQLMSEMTPSIRRDYIYIGGKMIGVIRNVKDGAAPEPKLDPPAPGPTPGNGLTFGFNVVSPVGVALSSAQLVRAPKTSSCNAGDPAGCSFTTVDTQSAPTNATYWTDHTSLTDAPPSGTYVYTVRVSDVGGATGVASPVSVDTTGDMTPAAFTFTDQGAVAANTSVASNIIQITGITGNVVTGVTGDGAYRICSNNTCSTNPAFITSPSAITNGLYLQLRATSSASNGGVINTVMSVGTVSDTWSVTTSGGNGPNAFSFADQTGVTTVTLINSNILQITGVTGTLATSIAGSGAYRICTDSACSANPAFITSASTISNGAYLQLRATSSSQYNTAVSTTMTVGSVSDAWSITTLSGSSCTQGTGGTITTSGQYTVHTFTTGGTFNPCIARSVEVLVVGGGGGGGGNTVWGGSRGGGGAGGLIYQASHLVSATSYPIVVGAGGAGGPAGQNTEGSSGSNSSFDNLVAIGGGHAKADGGSGGGASYYWGDGTTQFTTNGVSGQGHRGGASSAYEVPAYGSGGGGGAGEDGQPAHQNADGGRGGNGLAFSISGQSATYAGGGGGGCDYCPVAGGAGGSGGGGAGGNNSAGVNGAPNTGSGGGGSGGYNNNWKGGDGGSGIVIIRYLTTADTTPDSFTFTDVSGVAQSAEVTSNIVRITGVSEPVAVTITGAGATYRVCADGTCSSNPAFITTQSSIANGGYLQLRTTSSAGSSTAVTANVTVGTASDSWSVTTGAGGCSQPTGGTITTSGAYTIHTFTTSGTFNPCVARNVELLVIAGGGGGGGNAVWGGSRGGGGAGGVIYQASHAVSATGYPIVVGAGGAGGPAGQNTEGSSGSNSSFDNLVAIGGGHAKADGGSGGGASYYWGDGTTQFTTNGVTGQGHRGGASSEYELPAYGSGGGGGAGEDGQPAHQNSVGGRGGNGLAFNISGQSVTYAGGGGGGCDYCMTTGGAGGSGGAGAGGNNSAGVNGAPNTGSGGGGSGGYNNNWKGGDGGSGVVIIRYQTVP